MPLFKKKVREECSHQTQAEQKKHLTTMKSNDDDDSNSVSDHILSDDLLMKCISNISTSKDSLFDKSANALRKLFAMSENTSQKEYRTQMVTLCNGKLVPVLIDYLQRCKKGSSEQYLTLLIINNLSIPVENKSFIALDCNCVKILSKLICEDPSCHLICIILVNLSFADADLRRALIDPEIELIPALAFTLKITTMDPKLYSTYAEKLMAPVGEASEMSPFKYLSNLIAVEEEEASKAHGDVDYLHFNTASATTMTSLNGYNLESLVFPETLRWCLCALKNITYPLKSPITAAQAVLKCNLLPIILKLVTVDRKESHTTTKYAGSTVAPAFVINHPYKWEANSPSDVALSVLLNLCYTKSARPSLREVDTFMALVQIAEYSAKSNESRKLAEDAQMTTQCLKARMALSYLIGSEGHFGQPNSHLWSCVANVDRDRILVVLGSEAPTLLELFANSLHSRGKKGPGGYNAATFHLKQVLLALRCLLTNSVNIKTFYAVCGTKLNALLLKVIALFAFKESNTIDSEVAEYAIFSFYLMSNFGFNKPFLPNCYNHDLAAKILLCYSTKCSTSTLAKHTAEQLLLRLSHLCFDSSLQDDIQHGYEKTSDYELSHDILDETDKIVDIQLEIGQSPMDEIFNRPVVRNLIHGEGPRDVIFPSALDAVQHIVVDVAKVGPLDEVDDIVIANNIAINASGGMAPNYGFVWSWQDQSGRHLYRQKISSLFNVMTDRKIFSKDGPLSIFGLSPCSCTTVQP